MTIRWLFAAVHLLGLGVGLGSVWARSRAFRGALDAAGLRRVFITDIWWAVAGFIWVTTGLLRAFAGLEKGSQYYLSNHVFWLKMVLFITIVVLEFRTAPTIGRWRVGLRRGTPVDTSSAPTLARISEIQAFLVICIVFAATAMARGFGS